LQWKQTDCFDNKHFYWKIRRSCENVRVRKMENEARWKFYKYENFIIWKFYKYEIFINMKIL
jgi:hypothetical protein